MAQGSRTPRDTNKTNRGTGKTNRGTAKNGRGAYALGDDGRKGGGWWKWLLAALLLIAAIVLLIVLLSGGKDKKKTAVTPTVSTPAATAAAPSAPPAASSAKLTAGGASLLPATAGSLTKYVGSPAQGSAVRVLSVVENEGFFVGSSTSNRVYVEYGSAVGANEASGQYKAVVGDTVNLTGPVRPAPQDPAKTLKLDSDDAQLVSSEGGYINASKVAKTA